MFLLRSNIHVVLVCLTLAIIFSSTPAVWGKEVCVEVTGESGNAIKDPGSAKMEAALRAKLAAVDQVSGVDVTSKTTVLNAMLLDDIIVKKARGVVSGFTLINQQLKGDNYSLTAKVCVDDSNLSDFIAEVSRNSSVVVIVELDNKNNLAPADDIVKEMIKSTIGNKLLDKEFNVFEEVSNSSISKTSEGKGYNEEMVRKYMQQYLANVIVLITVSGDTLFKKGEDIGYSTKTPFNTVKVWLNYRIFNKDNLTGKLQVARSGHESANQTSPSEKDAFISGFEKLSNRISQKVVTAVSDTAKKSERRLLLKVSGVTHVDQALALKTTLQSYPWVVSVTEESLGSYWIVYGEKPIYLANSMANAGIFKIHNFDGSSITADYLKK
jgi:hypothetical protein